MNAHIRAGASRPVNGEALPLAWRVIADLYDRVDFQKDSIDGLRETMGLGVAAVESVVAQRDYALRLAEINAEAGAVQAAEIERLTEKVEIRKAVANEFRSQRDDALNENDRLKDTLTAIVLFAQDAPHGIADGHFERIISAAEFHLPQAGVADEVDPYPTGTDGDPVVIGADVQKEGIAFGLPPGFVEIDPASLPAAVVETIRARTSPDVRFYEVDAADVPRDLFRTIYGLDRQPEAEAEAIMTEADHFMIEAAMQYGFEIVDDDATVFKATERQIVNLMKAAREQGRQDAEGRGA